MTFGEARTMLRNDVLAELSSDYFAEEELLTYLRDAAREVAQAHGFPSTVEAIGVGEGAMTFALPAGVATIAVNEVTIDGWSLQVAPLSLVSTYQATPGVGNPRYYSYEPRRGGVVQFGPPTRRAGSVIVELVREYDTGAVDANSEIWEGLFPSWHRLVAFRAGAAAFDASLETERASYWQQRTMAMQQEFSAYLEKARVSQLVMAPTQGGEEQ